MKTSVTKLLIVYLLILSLSSYLPAQGPMVLVGCGSVIPGPLYGVWADAYASRNPRVRVNYLPLGSSEAIKQITSGAADFGAGEIPISDEEMKATGKKIHQLPLFLTAVVPIYNVPGSSQRLRFTGKVLADIFSGEIKRWNHPDLVKLNPHAELPNLPINTVHRESGKGTTYLFTEFLSKSSPAFHSKIGVSSSPDWPGATAQGGQGIVKHVADTPGAIGYAELNTARSGLVGIGLVQNANGVFIDASPETAAAACPPSLKGDMGMSLINRPGADVYPITGFSYMFVPADAPSGDRSEALRGFLKFIFTDGQSMIAARGHLPLPSRIVTSVLATLHLETKSEVAQR